MRKYAFLLSAITWLVGMPEVPLPIAQAASNVEALPEGGETTVTDRELWVVGGKLHADMAERPLLDVLQRLQNITEIEFRVDPNLSGPTVFGSFRDGLPCDEGVLRLLRWTSHAVMSDESGRITGVTVLGVSAGRATPVARRAPVRPEPEASEAAPAHSNVVIVGGRGSGDEPPVEDEVPQQVGSEADEAVEQPEDAPAESTPEQPEDAPRE